MEINWKVFATAILFIFLMSISYDGAIENFPWLTKLRWIIGVLAPVLMSGFVIGWLNVIMLSTLLAASNFPMLIGSWIRAETTDANIEH